MKVTFPEDGGKSVLRTFLLPLGSMSNQDRSEKGMAERRFSLAQDGMYFPALEMRRWDSEWQG